MSIIQQWLPNVLSSNKVNRLKLQVIPGQSKAIVAKTECTEQGWVLLLKDLPFYL